MKVGDLPTPALVLDAAAFEHNLATMAAALPGPRLRPHVKAHKCTAIAAAQARHGHDTFTCATPREVIGMAAAGLGEDLLLANEVLDAERLTAMAALGDQARVTLAVDNLLEAKQRVTDETGATPLRYQPYLIQGMAFGRTVSLSLRKSF